MLTLQSNGRLACPAAGLSSQQYRAVMAQPRQIWSEAKKQFTFLPTPLGCSDLLKAELGGDVQIVRNLAGRWLHHRFGKKESIPSFEKYVKTTPWKHQPSSIDFAVNCPSPYQNMGMGTGKSLITIASAAYCRHKRILILAPNAVVDVWPREFRRHAHDGEFLVVPLGLEYASVAKKCEAMKVALRHQGPVVIVINYESAHREPFASYASEIKWDAVVCDEIHRIKSPSGAAAKFARDLDCGHPIGLSGTMLPHDPLDAWSQFCFLEPALLGTSFMQFKKRYTIEGKFHQVVRFVNLEELHEKIRTITNTVSSDVLDLPEATHQQFTFSMSPKVAKAYKELKKELISRIDSGVVTADNVLVRGLRLQQLTSGFYQDDVTGKIVELDEQPKIDALGDWVDAIPRGEKFVVFARFKRDVATIARFLQKSEYKIGYLTGDQNDLTRDATFNPAFDCYVVNIASGGVGVDLTAANHAFYYSVSWNGADYEQSGARLRRPGQIRTVHFGHAICRGTVDEEIYAAFQEHKDLAEIVIHGLRKGGSS